MPQLTPVPCYNVQAHKTIRTERDEEASNAYFMILPFQIEIFIILKL